MSQWVTPSAVATRRSVTADSPSAWLISTALVSSSPCRSAGSVRFASRATSEMLPVPMVNLTRREAQALFSNPDLQIYPGAGMTCVFDPQRAACRIDRDDTDARRTPDLSDCRAHCANIARTDRDIERPYATKPPSSPRSPTTRWLTLTPNGPR